MFGRTHNNIRRVRRASFVAGAIGMALAGSMVTPQAFGTAADAPAGVEARSTHTNAADHAETPEAEVTYEHGVALAGTGELNGRQVFAEIYGNSLYGSQATVVVEQSGGPDLSATVELTAEELLDRDVDLDMALSRNTRGGPVATRSSARLTGTWELSGPAVQIDEEYTDAGYLIQVTGTNTPVSADVTITLDGEPVVVPMTDAFAFDLTVTRTAL